MYTPKYKVGDLVATETFKHMGVVQTIEIIIDKTEHSIWYTVNANDRNSKIEEDFLVKLKKE